MRNGASDHDAFRTCTRSCAWPLCTVIIWLAMTVSARCMRANCRRSCIHAHGACAFCMHAHCPCHACADSARGSATRKFMKLKLYARGHRSSCHQSCYNLSALSALALHDASQSIECFTNSLVSGTLLSGRRWTGAKSYAIRALLMILYLAQYGTARYRVLVRQLTRLRTRRRRYRQCLYSCTHEYELCPMSRQNLLYS